MSDLTATVQCFSELLSTLHTLFGPNGCPWDREQTHASVRNSLLEESYECMEAIDNENPTHLKEELGDLLLQVLFHGKLAERDSAFTISDILCTLNHKLIERHPHVFSAPESKNSQQVLDTWEEIKAKEASKRHRTSILDGVPKPLPALARADKLSRKAATHAQFDWENVKDVWNKIDEELAELREADSQTHISDELGDVLFALANLARHYKIDAEQALQKANSRFIARFQWMEQHTTHPLKELTPSEKESLWQKAKKHLQTTSL